MTHSASTAFILRRDETLARIKDTQWYRTTPGAVQLLVGARYCPDAMSFAAQLDVLSGLAGMEFVDLTNSRGALIRKWCQSEAYIRCPVSQRPAIHAYGAEWMTNSAIGCGCSTVISRMARSLRSRPG